MSEENSPQGQLMDIGTVAASNIAKALGLPGSSVETVRHAIRDEITAMSSHFTLVVADMQFQFDVKVREIRGTFKYVEENWAVLASAAFAVFSLGGFVGALVYKFS